MNIFTKRIKRKTGKPLKMKQQQEGTNKTNKQKIIK